MLTDVLNDDVVVIVAWPMLLLLIDVLGEDVAVVVAWPMLLLLIDVLDEDVAVVVAWWCCSNWRIEKPVNGTASVKSVFEIYECCSDMRCAQLSK